MKPKKETRLVRPVRGELLTYHVESAHDRQEPHLVDLLANEGAGECSCMDWQTRRWPLVRDGADIRSPLIECVHIRAAKRYFMNDIIASAIAHARK